MKKYTVATFYQKTEPLKLKSINAYLRDYNPTWPGCLIFEIEAESGGEAKKAAVAQRMLVELGVGN